jgi:hypothetical protein
MTLCRDLAFGFDSPPFACKFFSNSIGVPLNQQHGFVLSQNGVQLQTGQFLN